MLPSNSFFPGKNKRGTLHRPLLSGVDESGNMLVVDQGNNLLHVCGADKKCHVLKVPGIESKPVSAIVKTIQGTINIWVVTKSGVLMKFSEKA